MCYDIDVGSEGVYHQHIDHVYFARVSSRKVDPAGDDEPSAEVWAWYTSEELDAAAEHESYEADTVHIGREAIAAADQSGPKNSI